MTISLITAKYREHAGRDSLDRASIWQGNAGVYYGLNMLYSVCGAAQATTAAQVKTVGSAAQFVVGGRLLTKAATDNFWTLAGTTVAVSSFQKYALMVDDTGAASVQEATQNTVSAATVAWSNVVAAAKAVPQNPWAPIISLLSASRAIFATLTIATDATHTFIPGTTALNATGITATLIDGIDPTLMPVLANEKGLIHGLQL